MKKLAIFAAALLYACPGDPTVDDAAAIVGKVTDQAGADLPGARITTVPVSDTVITGADGSYRLEHNVRRGQTYQVLAAREGYREQTDTVFTEKGDNVLDFTLVLIVICTQGDARCVNQGTIERCGATGTVFTPESCPQGQVCDNSAGQNSAICSMPARLTLNVENSSPNVKGGLIVSTPAGLSCDADCTYDFPLGSMITLTAAPYALFQFAGFSGACTSSVTQCTLTMDAAKSVTATFDQNGNLLTLHRLGGRGRVTSMPAGINCGATCEAVFEQNAQVVLTADPDPGSAFGGWGGACSSAGTNLMCTVTLNRDLNVDFRFMTPEADLNVNTEGTGAGTVTSEPEGIDCGADCSETFALGTDVTLTASPMAGSTFVGWSGDCTGTGACMVSIDADRNVTATFDGIAHTVTVQKMGGGTGLVTSTPSGINCGNTCSATFGEGQSLQLSASPTNGSVFGGWAGACAAAMGNATCTVDVDANLNAIATFDPFFFAPFTADASCQILIHFDAPTPFAQQCGGGAAAVASGTYNAVTSRTPLLVTSVQSGGADEEGHVELSKSSPALGAATIEMSVRKAGAAYDARTVGVIYSDQDALDAATFGVRVYVRDDGRFGAETRAASGTVSQLESAANAIQDNVWYHVAATINSTTGIQLFIDGTRVAMGAGPLGWTASASTAWAGAEREGAAGSINRFNGTIDEIRVSDVLRY